MEPDANKHVMAVSEKGFGKRTDLEAYRVTNRGGKGIRTMNITDRTGHLVALMSVNDDNDLVIINKSGITLRLHVAQLRLMGRYTQGVRLINLEKRGDEIASVCCVDADNEAEVEEVDGLQEELPELTDEQIEDDVQDDDTDNIEGADSPEADE